MATNNSASKKLNHPSEDKEVEYNTIMSNDVTKADTQLKSIDISDNNDGIELCDIRMTQSEAYMSQQSSLGGQSQVSLLSDENRQLT